jgi:cytochrome c
MKAKGGTWTFGELYAFLANPRGYIPGTAMTFAGLSRGQQRADVIDFLHTLSDSPMALPKAAANAPAPAAGAKSAEAPKPAEPAAKK